MKFLTGDEIAREIKHLVEKRGEVRAAVAFWGSGAAEETGLASKGKGQILCDLFSGGCNPKEIEKLMGVGLEVRTLGGMHAKLWINGDSAILGSANASTNGLGFEHKAMTDALRDIPNTEVNVVIRDRSFSKNAEEWFGRQWGLAKPVTKLKLKETQLLWKRRKCRGPGRMSDTTILTAVNESRLHRHFSNLRLTAYTNEASDEAEQILQEGKREYPEACNIDFCEMDEAIVPGTVYMDFTFSLERKSKYHGMCKVMGTAQQSTSLDYRVVLLIKYFIFKVIDFQKASKRK